MTRNIFLAETYDVFSGLPFRSNARIQYERFVHSFHYPYIIHPHSLFRYYWDTFMCFFLVINNSINSMMRVLILHNSVMRQIYTASYQFVFLMDLILNVFTGYMEGDVAVLRPKRILINYLKTWFFFDLVCCLPVEVIVFIVHKDCYAPIILEEYFDCHVYVDFYGFVPYLKVVSFYRYFLRRARLKLLSDFLLRMVLIFVSSLLFSTLVVDISTQLSFMRNTDLIDFFCIDEDGEPCSIPERGLRYFHTISVIFLDSVYYESSNTMATIVLRIVILIFSFAGYIIIIAYCAQALLSYKSPINKYYEIEDSVRGYLGRKHLPGKTVRKALLYFQVLLSKKYFNKEEIFSFIPTSFKKSIVLHQRASLLEKSLIFSGFPKQILEQLACSMVHEVYLLNDVVVRAGDRSKSMFFINVGCIALYTDKNYEYAHRKDGSYFGEESLISNQDVVQYSAVAIEVSELYRIDVDEFLEIMELTPTLYEDFKKVVEHVKA